MNPNPLNQELVKAISQKTEKPNPNPYQCPRANCLTIIESYVNGTLIYGMNHAPNGEPSCKESGCIIENNHCVRSLHSEEIAIAIAAKRGVPTEGANAYLSQRPCNRCMGIMAEAGIAKVYYHNDYHSKVHSEEYCSENLKKLLQIEKV